MLTVLNKSSTNKSEEFIFKILLLFCEFGIGGAGVLLELLTSKPPETSKRIYIPGRQSRFTYDYDVYFKRYEYLKGQVDLDCY